MILRNFDIDNAYRKIPEFFEMQRAGKINPKNWEINLLMIYDEKVHKSGDLEQKELYDVFEILKRYGVIGEN